MLNLYTHEFFMKEALKEAQQAYNKDEVPVGAVVVCNDRIIARAHNLTERLTDVTAHAEMQAFTAASNFLGSKYLEGCRLYVTLEPCVMCAGAAFWTQIDQILFGAGDPKRGFLRMKPSPVHPKTIVTGGIMEAQCAALLRKFFENKR